MFVRFVSDVRSRSRERGILVGYALIKTFWSITTILCWLFNSSSVLLTERLILSGKYFITLRLGILGVTRVSDRTKIVKIRSCIYEQLIFADCQILMRHLPGVRRSPGYPYLLLTVTSVTLVTGFYLKMVNKCKNISTSIGHAKTLLSSRHQQIPD